MSLPLRDADSSELARLPICQARLAYRLRLPAVNYRFFSFGTRVPFEWSPRARDLQSAPIP